MTYIEYAKWGPVVPSGVLEQSPGRVSGHKSPSEAEAFCWMPKFWCSGRKFFSECIGRIDKATDSVLHYEVANGHTHAYYYHTRSASYTPRFDLAATATPQQKQEAAQHCTVNGKLNKQCEYDYLATGNGAASRYTATTSATNVAEQTKLGLFVILLAMSSCNKIVRQYIRTVTGHFRVYWPPTDPWTCAWPWSPI